MSLCFTNKCLNIRLEFCFASILKHGYGIFWFCNHRFCHDNQFCFVLDYDGMCRSLTEKERQLVELRERMDEKIGLIQREHNQEKIRLEQDRSAAVTDRDLARYQEPVTCFIRVPSTDIFSLEWQTDQWLGWLLYLETKCTPRAVVEKTPSSLSSSIR